MKDFDNNSRSHQLYFFSKEAEKVRKYFGGLLFINNNNNNVHQNEEVFNYEKLTHQIAVLTGKSNQHQLISQLLRTDEALKVIVALLFKGFSWTNELFETFNISKKMYVQNTLWTLQNLNLLVKEEGENLNIYYFEALEKSKSGKIRKALHQTNMYYITKEFVNFASMLTELLEYKVRQSESFRFSLRKIVNDSKKFKEIYDRIIDEETTLFEREFKTNEGVIYYKDTVKAKNFKKELSKNLKEVVLEKLELKQSQGLLSNQEKNKLILFKKDSDCLALVDETELEIKNFRKSKRPKIMYNGKEINDKYFEELQQKYQDIIKELTVIGKPELATQKSIFDNGLYLSKSERDKWVESKRPKSAIEEAEDFFGGYENESN